MANGNPRNQSEEARDVKRRNTVAKAVTAADERDARRGKVETLMLSGASLRAMGKTLGVSYVTIRNDIEALRKQWHQESMQMIDTAIMTDVKRIDRMILAIWQDTLNAKDMVRMEMIRKFIETRAKLLGYDMAAMIAAAEQEQKEGTTAVRKITTIEVVKSYNSDKDDDGDDQEEI